MSLQLLLQYMALINSIPVKVGITLQLHVISLRTLRQETECESLLVELILSRRSLRAQNSGRDSQGDDGDGEYG